MLEDAKMLAAVLYGWTLQETALGTLTPEHTRGWYLELSPLKPGWVLWRVRSRTWRQWKRAETTAKALHEASWCEWLELHDFPE